MVEALSIFGGYLFALMIGHAIADYAYQSQFMADGKNKWKPIPGHDWWIVLMNHSLIHAGAVWAITGMVWLAVAEFVLHFLIDTIKCAGWLDFREDQFLHFLCKALFAAIVLISI